MTKTTPGPLSCTNASPKCHVVSPSWMYQSSQTLYTWFRNPTICGNLFIISSVLQQEFVRVSKRVIFGGKFTNPSHHSFLLFLFLCYISPLLIKMWYIIIASNKERRTRIPFMMSHFLSVKIYMSYIDCPLPLNLE